ncbi:unnamed protein product [Adineta steineri]|uniref:Uncharacterized protein n=2 Tax=Adineta steineri TaxID=433720 RepID=A0A820BY04_9BILA|nr:unnamed protein product [Adineta steineri]
MNLAREGHTASTLANGLVLVAGGYNIDVGYLDSAELYNPSTGTWITTANMTARREFHTASSLANGSVLVTGGHNRFDDIIIFIKLSLQSFHKVLCNKWNIGNIFDSRSSDPLIICREILSTRLYIVLLIISLITLTTYTSINYRIENKIVILPSQSIYENLQNRYANILHSIISQQWIDFIFQTNSTSIWPIDVRTSLSAMWQLIRAFCQSSINIITDAFNQFDNSTLTNTMLLTEELLEAKVQAALSLLRQTAPSTLTQANQLVTRLLTNYIAVTHYFGLTKYNPLFDIDYMNVSLYAGIFENKYILKNSIQICSCQNNGSCPSFANICLYKIFEIFGIYDLNRVKANETLSECFYNQSCLNILLSSYTNSLNISILNQSLSSRSLSTTKIELLINELFLEEMFNQTNYTKYYSP